ncbi:MAG TPA: helix-hairpin-helix domain-containing protein, partial [Chitinophagaceae bacterium]|nr:helix-hairpin-helix domain-containing protein [Chitinophagaceae bacterium]
IHAQETPVSTLEQQIENLTDVDQAETEDDSYQQQWERFRKHPLNLNTADETDLRELKILSGLQIANFILYRKLLGKFISVYELQAVPAWNIQIIKKLLPFITIEEPINMAEVLKLRFKNGEHGLLFRYSQVLEESNGFEDTTNSSKYLGSPTKLFFRYRYQYRNLLQFGVLGEKDAGEQFLKGAQNKGFDFYSFHLFTRKLGIVQSLALGDFTVNMGQGLIQWQSLAFRKSVDVPGIKRQSPVLRPYNSAGEFNFHRGAGITIQQGNVQATAFVSYRKLSANFVADTVSHEEYITSFLNSGYHRTESEIADRHKLGQMAFGGNLKYKNDRWHTGVNAIVFNFSTPVQKRQEPYNLYAFGGGGWSNYSIDYSYTLRNLHFFGEAAIDKNFNKALLNGLLISVDPKVDLSFQHRKIDPQYQSVNGNAVTENTYPTNETGLYSGISIRPVAAWRLDAYVDIYKFPWLKYLVDAPSRGKDFITQLTYIPNKEVEVYTRYRSETKQANQHNNSNATNHLVQLPRQNWRTQISFKINRSITVRNRTELLWYNKNGENEENGFLTFFDIIYKPMLRNYGGNIRLQYFETDEYNSRIYAYENDVLFYYSIPAFFNKGFRYYLNLHYDLSSNASIWLKWSQTIYRNVESIGSGPDEIPGFLKSEIRVMTRIIF